jgi:hypothetical protein
VCELLVSRLLVALSASPTLLWILEKSEPALTSIAMMLRYVPGRISSRMMMPGLCCVEIVRPSAACCTRLEMDPHGLVVDLRYELRAAIGLKRTRNLDLYGWGDRDLYLRLPRPEGCGKVMRGLLRAAAPHP